MYIIDKHIVLDFEYEKSSTLNDHKSNLQKFQLCANKRVSKLKISNFNLIGGLVLSLDFTFNPI